MKNRSTSSRSARLRRRKHRHPDPLQSLHRRFDHWPLPVIVSDRQFVPRYWNAKARQLFGERQWETIRQHLSNRAIFLAAPLADPLMMERLKTGSLDPWHEDEMVTQDGRQLFCRWSSIPMRNSKGVCIGVISVAQDITEHRDAERLRKESEKRFRIMADHAPVMIWMADENAKCTYFNKPLIEFNGRTLEEEPGDGWTEGVHPEDLERYQEVYQSAYVARQTFKMEYRLRRHDGQYRWVLDNGIPLLDEAGVFTGYIGSCVDISDHRALLQEMENSHALLKGTLDSTADGILVVDGKGKMLIFNNRFVEMWHLPKEIMMTRDDNRAIAFVKEQLKDPASFLTSVSNMYAHMEEVKCDPLEFKDGRVYERYTIPCLIKGRIIGRVFSFRDITTRRKTEEELLHCQAALLQEKSPTDSYSLH